MTDNLVFPGFPKEIVDFFRRLSHNNKKEWFEEHRSDYERFVLGPCRDFVEVMGLRLKDYVPEIHADPRINKSLFKIFRDTRFSKDKTAFKTHMATWFWEGSGPRMECSGFYFHLEPTLFIVGAGIYIFPKHLLEKYRLAVVDKKQGAALVQAVEEVKRTGKFDIWGRHYKRTPRGFDPQHPNADFLLFNGLSVGRTMEISDLIHQPELVDFCLDHFREALPIHRWLVDLTRQA